MGLICHIDTETTGTDEYRDPIIELAYIITTDRSLREITRGTHVIRPKNYEAAMARMNGYVRDMHTGNGLLADLETATETIEEVTEKVVAAINRSRTGGASARVPLGGSGVSHFDRRFIAAQMPELDEVLTYWAFDVGSVRRHGKKAGITPPESGDASLKSHRALDDIEMHVEEMRWWFAFLRLARKNGIERDMLRGGMAPELALAEAEQELLDAFDAGVATEAEVLALYDTYRARTSA